MSAEPSIRVVIKDHAVVSAFARLVALGESPKAVYDDIGEHLLISTRERTSHGISPDGTPFAPLNPRYAALKQKKVGDRPILEYDLHMVGNRFTYAVDQQGLLIGTGPEKAIHYGRAQQFGYKPPQSPTSTPARHLRRRPRRDQTHRRPSPRRSHSPEILAPIFSGISFVFILPRTVAL